MHRPQPALGPSEDGASTKQRSRSVLRDAVDLYVQAPTHDRSEIRAFGDLAGGLLADVGTADRRHVSETLSKRADAPLELARRLALDVAEVAAPMIVASPVLTSSDLVQILRRGPEHVRLVAERLDLGADLASVLIDSKFARVSPDDDASAPAAPSDSSAMVAPEAPLPTIPIALPANETPAPVPPAAPYREAAPMAASPIAPPVTTAATAPAAIPHFRVPLRAEAATARDTNPAPDRGRGGPPTRANPSFLDLDSGERWRAIQLATAEVALSSQTRTRTALDVGALTDRLFTAAVERDVTGLTSEIAEALDLDATTAARVVGDTSGEPLAVALAALGVDERRGTSVLLLLVGEGLTLAQMQDLAAMAGRIGRRTAEHLVAEWRPEKAGRAMQTRRVLDGAERREAPSAKPAERGGDSLRAAMEELARRSGGEGR